MNARAISGTALLLIGTSLQAQRPNVVIIMTDQQRADLTAREGFPLDLTPFVDSMARTGAWFDRAYTPCPASGPARVAMLSGRFTRATRVDCNMNLESATFGQDLFGLARVSGYNSVLVGKNHSHMTPDSADFWINYDHLGQPVPASVKGEANAEFDKFLKSTSFFTSLEPAPGTVENQQPYRIVSSALEWASEHGSDKPFVMWMSFPEPHNPYQVCEPYYSMFEGKVPSARTSWDALPVKGEKFVHLHKMMNIGHRGMDENLERVRANYMGMIRLIDDQLKRFVGGMQELGLYENTVFVVLADHGDFAGEYGLMKKGTNTPDVLTRVPMVWFSGDIAASGLRHDCVSLVDVFPTICELMGEEIPMGVQGRSLLPMLTGREYPREEFRSIMSETGFGGQFITEADADDYQAEGACGKGGKDLFFDELNSWSQSGTITMVRMGDWKLAMDMLGNGELYNVVKDPSEMKNLYGRRRYRRVQGEMLAELLKWQIATNDPLPVPSRRYRFKRFEHNYLFYEK